MEIDYSLKIGIIGKSKSGKSCLIQKYFTGIFESEYYKTIFLKVHYGYFCSTHGNLELELYDISCDEFGMKQLPLLINKMNGLILIVDGTEDNFSEMLSQWKLYIDSINQVIPILGLINKSDLMNKKQFQSIPKMKFPLFTISLKNCKNYQYPIITLVQTILSLPILFSTYMYRLQALYSKETL